MIRKTLFASALAGVMALTSVAATPAIAAPDTEDYIKTILGAVILGAIAKAAKDQRSDREVTRGSNRPDDWRYDRDNRGHRGNRLQALPARCETTIRTRSGRSEVFGSRCLRNEGVRVERLPSRCEFDVRGQRHERTVFGKRCLEREGYRVEARRRH